MRNQQESKLQQSCVRWFDMQYPKLKLNLFSIPNEGARTIANGARMKAQGRRAGTADMFLAVSHICEYEQPITHEESLKLGNSYGLFIEFKYEKGKQNENQIAFQKAVEKEGYRYEVVTDFDQFQNLINSYLL